jgi:methylmalonyl-CoA/ethylmalonyl-CoA epimerase
MTMKILQIDHIGVACSSIDKASPFWCEVLGLPVKGMETVEEQKVTTMFLPVGECKIEVLESTDDDGPVANYIKSRGEGIQHIALRVENIEEAIKELKEKGVRLINETPRIGAGGAKIIFIHPKSTNGILLELTEHADHTDH